MKSFKSLSYVKGFSLTELLIASVLGLLLLGGVIQLFIGSKQTYVMQNELGNVQTDGRFALMFIERLAENTAWRDNLENTVPDSAVFGIKGAAYDEVSFTLYSMENSFDCNGTNIVNKDIVNRVYVNGSTLLCQGNGGAAAQPIIENVEAFKVLFGLDSNKDGLVNRYVTADSLTNEDFRKVLSVKIALLIATEEDANTEAIEQDFDLLGYQVNVNDKKLRRMFSKTIHMPNQAYPIVRTL